MREDSQVSKVLRHLDQCSMFADVYALERSFNSIGLTIQHTGGRKVILCRLIEGQPIAENVCDDFIFLGSLDRQHEPLDDRTVRKLHEFIIRAHGPAGTLMKRARSWQQNLGMQQAPLYSRFSQFLRNQDCIPTQSGELPTCNEDIDAIADDLLME